MSLYPGDTTTYFGDPKEWGRPHSCVYKEHQGTEIGFRVRNTGIALQLHAEAVPITEGPNNKLWFIIRVQKRCESTGKTAAMALRT